jgi:predicted nucleic acid-binding Zn ribbon protein
MSLSVKRPLNEINCPRCGATAQRTKQNRRFCSNRCRLHHHHDRSRRAIAAWDEIRMLLRDASRGGEPDYTAFFNRVRALIGADAEAENE